MTIPDANAKYSKLNLETLEERTLPYANPFDENVQPVSQIEPVKQEHLEINSDYYTKFVDAKGVTILGSKDVSALAFSQAEEIIDHMLSGTAKELKDEITKNVKMVILSKLQNTTDIPEFEEYKDFDEINNRARGLYKPSETIGTTLFPEENLTGITGDRWKNESTLVHEFGHAIHFALEKKDPEFANKIEAAYDAAIKNNVWKDTYSATNKYEYWAVGVACYFDAANQSEKNDGVRNFVNTAEELAAYDPELYKLIDTTFDHNPWRFQYVTYRSTETPLADSPLALERATHEIINEIKNRKNPKHPNDEAQIFLPAKMLYKPKPVLQELNKDDFSTIEMHGVDLNVGNAKEALTKSPLEKTDNHLKDLLLPSSNPFDGIVNDISSLDGEKARHLDSQTDYYKKYANADGVIIFGSEGVTSVAFSQGEEILNVMLSAVSPEVKKEIQNNAKLVILDDKEQITDIPEVKRIWPEEDQKSYRNYRYRGVYIPEGDISTIVTHEENLIGLIGDRWKGSSTIIHEIAHAVQKVLQKTDPDFAKKITAAYEYAMQEGLWKDSYSATNEREYWAVAVASYFDGNIDFTTNNAGGSNIRTAEDLVAYDPEIYKLIDQAFHHSPWRFNYIQNRSSKTPLADSPLALERATQEIINDIKNRKDPRHPDDETQFFLPAKVEYKPKPIVYGKNIYGKKIPAAEIEKDYSSIQELHGVNLNAHDTQKSFSELSLEQGKEPSLNEKQSVTSKPLSTQNLELLKSDKEQAAPLPNPIIFPDYIDLDSGFHSAYVDTPPLQNTETHRDSFVEKVQEERNLTPQPHFHKQNTASSLRQQLLESRRDKEAAFKDRIYLDDEFPSRSR